MTTNLRSAVETTSIPESICSRDERVRVNPESSPPYKYICSLLLEDKNGSQYAGSGFKIHVPSIYRCIVVTAAHNVYINGAYCKKITVTFPGQAAVTVNRETDLYASQEYRDSKDTNHDYGMVLLPGNSDEGFGWSAIIPDSKLTDRVVTNCGYPYDKQPWPEIWITGGEITQVHTYKLDYMNDIYSGHSGSPVYTWYKGHWTVVGIHTNGGCPNRATRLTSHMMYNFLNQARNLKKYSLRSVEFGDVYVRCADGTSVQSHQGESGGGTINCLFMRPMELETFYIIPVAATPSLAQEQTYIVALQNLAWSNTYVHMDGRNITKYAGETGGGVVNCQWSGEPASEWESFIFKKNSQQQCSFQSVKFPNRYIRLDGRGVTRYTGSGGGVVNCQFCDKDSDVSAWEKFTLEE